MTFDIEIVGRPNEKILINGKTIVLDANGCAKISSDVIRNIQDKSVSEFDRELDTLLTKDQKKSIYMFLLNSTRFGIKDLADLLGLSKSIIRSTIISLAIKHEMVVKYESQWRIIREVKDDIRTLLKNLEYPDMFTPNEELTAPLVKKRKK